MPLSSGLAIHTDSKHSGDAKRGMAGGLASLDVNGKLEFGTLKANSQSGEHIPKIASGNLRNSHDVEEMCVISTWTKEKSIALDNGIAGVLTIKHDNYNWQAGDHTYSRVYKNGVPLGAIHDNSAAVTYTTYSEDLDVGVMQTGETLELWAYYDTGVGPSHKVRNFRLYYDNNPPIAVDTTNTAP